MLRSKTLRFATGLLIAAALALLSSCAGTAADENFRRKVSAVEVTAAVAADQAGQYGGNAGAKFTLRDPDARSRPDNK
jgi:hypothetical protein